MLTDEHVIEVRATSRTLEFGGRKAALASAEDITERKRAEKSLVESERRYRSLLGNIDAGFVLFEVLQDDRGRPADLVIVAANKGAEAATGLKLQDAAGKRLTQVLPGTEKDAADWIGTYGKVALKEGLLGEVREVLNARA
jgi:PAS domain-containing protein